MRCRHCQTDNAIDSRFCDGCGASLTLACNGCGAQARASARFCSQCGNRLGGDRPGGDRPGSDRLGSDRLGGDRLGGDRLGHRAGVDRPNLDRTGGAAFEAPAVQPPTALTRHIDEGERKQVTVLFADIRGSTALIEALDPELAMGLLDPAIAAMAHAVQRFGGTVNRIQGDGLMALFGAPAASEDHAARACLAGQAILAAVAAQVSATLPNGLDSALEVRVGIHSGEVVIRSVGLDPSDYDAVGVTVHLAHRIEQRAEPGSVCLSARTALLAHGTVDLEPLGEHVMPGIVGPVELFRLLSAHERPAWEVRAAAGAMTSFVGRSSEMRLLETALGRAGLGRGQVVTLTADAGLGKSRLVHEFLKRLPPGVWNVLSAAAMGHGQGTPYRLAADILRVLLGVDRSDPLSEIVRKLAHSLAVLQLADIAEAAPLESLLDLPIADPEWARLSPDSRRERMLPALRLVMLRSSAVRPLLLLVEDLHWADPQSEALLEALVDGLGAARVMMVVTSRPGRQPGWAGRGNRSYCAGMSLGPLAPAAAEALLEQLLGSGAELAELRARIVSQSDGTPLFIEELARALIEQGIVVSEPPTLRLTRKADSVQIPASVQAVLSARIDQLPTERRRLLQVAAVIGKDVPRDILAAMAELPETTLATTLSALQSAEFLYEVNLAGGIEYTFKHALTRAVAYEGMLRRQRRELHARVLAVMEAKASDRAAEFTEVLADHAMRGEVWVRAAELAFQAGRRANARSAWPEAVTFFEQSLAALGHLPESRETLGLGIDIRLGLRVALGPLLELDRVVRLLDEASELAAKLDDPARTAQIDVSRCVFETILGSLDSAVAAGERSLRSAARLADSGPLLNASYALAQAHWFAGDFPASLKVLEANLATVRGPMRLSQTGMTGTVSVLYLSCLSKTHAITGDFVSALALAEEAQSIADETRKPYDLTYARLAAGFAHLIAGAHELAAVDLESALAHCRDGGVPLLVPSVARYLGRAHAELGRHKEAHSLLDEALLACHAQRMVALTVWCGLASGATHLASEAHEPALSMLTTTLELADRHAYRPAAAHGLHLVARTRLARGETVKGFAALDAAESLSRALGMQPELYTIALTRRRFD